CQQYNSWISF
nr:immunoglobulin light chain junction region [Macaca mulatta]MOX53373.1 immunoglobulin light chain junction region [Macaca mulatta]MOX56927.1 immunoglobulin light chain junction region [Macaca mulatta]MOX57372.1 immunoglobulin light chain junction region [Macaca mulatta]MOX58303.1 immunoglobulin light chain junction region [Macaca mulatta]